MNFKEMYLSGLCGMEYMDTCVEQWHGIQEDGVSLREYLGLTEHEYEVYLQQDVSFAPMVATNVRPVSAWQISAFRAPSVT